MGKGKQIMEKEKIFLKKGKILMKKERERLGLGKAGPVCLSGPGLPGPLSEKHGALLLRQA